MGEGDQFSVKNSNHLIYIIIGTMEGEKILITSFLCNYSGNYFITDSMSRNVVAFLVLCNSRLPRHLGSNIWAFSSKLTKLEHLKEKKSN